MTSSELILEFLTSILTNRNIANIVKEYFAEMEDKNFVKLSNHLYLNVNSIRTIRIENSMDEGPILWLNPDEKNWGKLKLDRIEDIRKILRKINNSEMIQDFEKISGKKIW